MYYREHENYYSSHVSTYSMWMYMLSNVCSYNTQTKETEWKSAVIAKIYTLICNSLLLRSYHKNKDTYVSISRFWSTLKEIFLPKHLMDNAIDENPGYPYIGTVSTCQLYCYICNDICLLYDPKNVNHSMLTLKIISWSLPFSLQFVVLLYRIPSLLYSWEQLLKTKVYNLY